MSVKSTHTTDQKNVLTTLSIPNEQHERPGLYMLKNEMPMKPTSKRHGSNKNTVPVIDENQEYSFANPPLSQMTRSSTRSSASSGKISRKISSQYNQQSNGVSNAGFAGSTESSLHGGSENSLPVIREQYCCCSRWSRLERNLLIVVGVLAAIIIILLIIVTILSQTSSDARVDKWWSL